MARTLRAIISILVSVVTLVFVMQFLGVTWKDVDYFVTNSMREAVKILSLFRGIFSSSPANF
jgi:uncharacterized metal-binding protein